MPRVDVVVETAVQQSSRVRQLEAMFDVPPFERAKVEWHGDLDFEARPWRVGLIVGPSGSGKSTLLRHLFGEPQQVAWDQRSVIDNFPREVSVSDIAALCQAVGFNTIPAWMRPYAVLSNGERFRVDLARQLSRPGDVIIDEFTSVVDRQVAQIGSHAVQKYIRRAEDGRRFVAASCHFDIIDWLQPDWVLEPATMSLTWRDLQRRPPLSVAIGRVPYATWSVFAPFHYLTADLHKGAKCYALWVHHQLAAFAGVLHRPTAARDIEGVSRLVTLPDYQGLGLALALVDQLGAAFKAVGKRLHTYPAHPSLVRSFDRSTVWSLVKRPGMTGTNRTSHTAGKLGGRPCATFCYAGQSMDHKTASRLLGL